jgi:alkaline phosphatase D
VILWTRVSGAVESVPVDWRIARDPALEQVLQEGTVPAMSSRDHTVKLDVLGLEPGTSYYYEFRARGRASPRGRTRTLPVGPTERIRLAFASCANLPFGHFNAYQLIARRADLDVVLHLGDYLYEYANDVYGDGRPLGRVPEPDREIVSLSDYRTRHAQYKRDPDLQEVHRQHAFIAVWDDHEIADNAWSGGASNHDPTEGEWGRRRDAAVRAYLEWMPVRESFDGPTARLQRTFRFGDLADLVMLDTRLYGRDAQVDRRNASLLQDPERSLLGRDQEAWLAATLRQSQRDGTAWRVLGQQVMLAPLRASDGGVANPDAWDGYPGSRERLLSSLASGGVSDVICLTGDVHSSWALEVPRDPYAGSASGGGSPALAVEFTTPGITSPGRYSPPEAARRAEELLTRHPHLRWVDLHQRGYALLDLDHERAQAEWWFVETLEERRPAEVFGRAYQTRLGESRLVRASGPSPVPAAAPLAP